MRPSAPAQVTLNTMSTTTHSTHSAAEDIRTLVREELPRLVEIRHDLHMHP